MISALLVSTALVADIGYKKLTKSQIILEAKHCAMRYEMLNNKKEAWNKRKQVLINDFSEIYEDDSNFGEKNHYGKQRMEQRLQDFYTSLKAKDEEIQNNLTEVNEKLNALKEYFLTRYGYSLNID